MSGTAVFARSSLSPALALTLVLVPPAPAQTRWSLVSGFRANRLVDHGMAYDEARDEVVVHQGWNHFSLSPNPWTWVWDGTAWSSTAPPARMGQRYEIGMTYDPDRGRIVMFGGADGFRQANGDTWEWDGARWHEILRTASSPPARWGHVMWFDRVLRRVLMFGGADSSRRFDDTWAWDGTSWTELDPLVSPSPRTGMAIAYDLVRKRAVMFGGGSGQTWEWDGTTWEQQRPARSPVGRPEPAMAYDLARRRTVMFGGGAWRTERNDTWEWDGTTWEQLSPGNRPGGRFGHAMVYDTRRRRVLMHGGEACYIDCSGLPGLLQLTTVEPGSFTGFGTGCATTAGPLQLMPHLGSVPWTGDTLDLDLQPLPSTPGIAVAGVLGSSATTWGSLSLPYPLTPLGAPGCTLYVSAEATAALGAAPPSARWSVPIPMSSGLVGQAFYVQGFVLGDPANPGRISASNAGEAVVGMR